MNNNIIRAVFNPGDDTTKAYGLHQWNYGQKLEIHGLDLPRAVEVHFAAVDDTEAIVRIGTTADKVTTVPIPDVFFEQEMDIKAYVYLSDSQSGETIKTINLPMVPRQKPEGWQGSEETTMGAIMDAINQFAAGKADGLDYKDNILKLMSGETELARVTIAGGAGGTAREIELQKSDTAIQWRYVGEEDWKDLVPLEDLKPTGEQIAEVVGKYLEENPIQGEETIVFDSIEDGEIFAVVESLIPCAEITLSASELSFDNNTPITLDVKVTPSDTTDVLVWKSHDTSIAIVENGVVTPVKNGNCTITATCGECSASCIVVIDIKEEIITPTVKTKAYIETVDGMDYIVVKSINDLMYLQGSQVAGATGETNEKYAVYQLNNSLGIANILDLSSKDFFGDTIPRSISPLYDDSAASNIRNTLLNDTTEGDLCCIGKNGVNYYRYLRLPVDLGGYSTVNEYLQATYGEIKFKLVDGYKTKVIDPTLITSMYKNKNSYNGQFAQFNYGDLPISNIYSGANSLCVCTGTNANLTNHCPPKACISTTVLCINFEENTFEDFTLDNVKQYLTDNQLIFWYMES